VRLHGVIPPDRAIIGVWSLEAVCDGMRVLGIETSCDETGIALYDTERGLLADALYSQVAVHAEYGGFDVGRKTRGACRGAGYLVNPTATL
jgi:hypothetical protein